MTPPFDWRSVSCFDVVHLHVLLYYGVSVSLCSESCLSYVYGVNWNETKWLKALRRIGGYSASCDHICTFNVFIEIFEAARKSAAMPVRADQIWLSCLCEYDDVRYLT
jgi:hypothetical protein